MTITFLQPDGVAITAQAARQGSAAVYGGGAGRPLGGRSGFRVDTPSNVLTATSTTWTLGPCAAMIDPGATTHQGMYGLASDANVTGSVTAADATNARKDIVYIQVNDSSAGDGSGAKSANVLYLAGTPSATPVAPALPARSFLVGTIDVPKSGAGAPVVTVNPARFVAAGGILPVNSQAERDALTKFGSFTVRRMDASGALEDTDGTTWTRRNDFVPVNTSDVNWTYYGGVYVERGAGGPAKATCEMILTRTGGNIPLTTAYTPAFSGIIPAGIRPNGVAVTTYTVLQNANTDPNTTDVWGLYVRINKAGDLAISTNSGSATITTGNKVAFTLTWLI